MLKRIDPTSTLSGLKRGRALQSLLARLDERNQTTRIVRPLLPDELQPRCQQASLEKGCLTLVVESPAWVAKARLAAPRVLAALGRKGLSVKRCKVRVSPPMMDGAWQTEEGGDTDAASRHRPSRLSTTAALHLEQAAAAETDPELSACFRRMAARRLQRA